MDTDQVTADDVVRLSRPQTAPVVSIYLPTQRITSRDFEQDKIQFKNYVRHVRAQLKQLGIRDKIIDQQLHPAWQLLDDEYFWTHQDNGLAVLLGPDASRVYQTAYTFQPLCAVAPRFHIKQLLPILQDDYYYYILRLSPKCVQLLRATSTRIEPITMEQLPSDITDALGEETDSPGLSFHPGGGSGGSGAFFHGHGDINNYKKEELQKFVRVIAERLQTHLRGQAPLILACADQLEASFRHVYKDKQLHANHLSGNFDNATDEQLHEQTLPHLKQRLEADKSRALERYQQLSHQEPERTAGEMQDIMSAAYSGEVETLLVQDTPRYWGVIQEDSVTQWGAEAEPGLSDITDVAAAYAHSYGRDVYLTKEGELPGDTAMAAIVYPST